MVYKPFSYRFTETAKSDIDEIVGYMVVNLANPEAAETFYNNLERTLDNICKMPKIGHLIENEFCFRDDVRKISFNNYFIYYIIDEPINLINILHVVYAKREQNTIIAQI